LITLGVLSLYKPLFSCRRLLILSNFVKPQYYFYLFADQDPIDTSLSREEISESLSKLREQNVKFNTKNRHLKKLVDAELPILEKIFEFRKVQVFAK
jgi:hypothetical protein